MPRKNLLAGHGINLYHDAEKASRGHAAFGVVVEVTIGSESERRGSKWFRTFEQAAANFEAVARELDALRVEEQKRQDILNQLPPLPPTPKGMVLFETFADNWLRLDAKPRTAATVRSYRSLLDTHILPIMRAWPMSEDVITAPRLLDHMLLPLFHAGVSLATRKHVQACLSAAFTYALSRPEYPMKINPAIGLGRLLRQESERRIKRPPPNPMTPKQAEAYLAWIYAHARRWWEFLLFLHDTGVRVGECSAVKWPNVYLAERKAHIVDNFSASERSKCIEAGEDPTRPRADDSWPGENDTKTHRTDQWIQLTPDLADVLDPLRSEQRKYSLKAGHRVPVHCFTTRHGTPRRPDGDLQRVHDAACTALDLKGELGQPFTIHNIRDTFATTHIMKGTPYGWVARQLGHASEETVKRHYYKWVALREEGDLASRLVESGTRLGTRKRDL